MNIIKRHKNFNGDTVGYTVSNGVSDVYLDSSAVIAMGSMIENATLLSNGEFRAKSGYSIDTIVGNSNLQVKPGSEVANVKGNNAILDYYGKGYIDICKKIRKYAIADKFRIDMRKHNSNGGNNTYLFKLIEACGISVRSFICGYLSVLQPYTLSKFQASRNIGKENIWLIDTGYGVSLVIKINDSSKEKPVVVSFHESNKNGSFSLGKKSFSDKPCAVLVDSVFESSDALYKVKYTIQRGFIRYTVNSLTRSYENGVALVKYSDISDILNNLMLSIVQNMANTYKDEFVDESSFVVFSSGDFNKLTFMSMGYNKVNNICLLLDLYARYTDKKSRMVIVELTANIINEMPEYRLEELKSALADRYEGSRNKLYLTIKDMG